MVESKQESQLHYFETESSFWLDPQGIFLLRETTGLSKQKRWVLGFLIQGLTYAEIAEQLAVTKGVVENIVSHVGSRGIPGLLQDLRAEMDEDITVNRRSLLWVLARRSWLRIDWQRLMAASSEVAYNSHISKERLKAVEMGLKGYSAEEIAGEISFERRTVYRYHGKVSGGADNLVGMLAWYVAQAGGVPPGFEDVLKVESP